MLSAAPTGLRGNMVDGDDSETQPPRTSRKATLMRPLE